jgi:hypothetical protein
LTKKFLVQAVSITERDFSISLSIMS